MAKIIDGKEISVQIRAEISEKVKKYNERTGKLPGLAVVIVGDGTGACFGGSVKHGKDFFGRRLMSSADGSNDFSHHGSVHRCGIHSGIKNLTAVGGYGVLQLFGRRNRTVSAHSAENPKAEANHQRSSQPLFP